MTGVLTKNENIFNNFGSVQTYTMNFLLAPQALIETYKYYPWYEVYKLYRQGVAHTSHDQIWHSFYTKYFPKSCNKVKIGKESWFEKFVTDLVLRLFFNY